MNPDFYFGVIDGDYIYDEETYPNHFSIGLEHAVTGARWEFEISDRRNDIQVLIAFITTLARHDVRMIGFNNVGFDYPVLHFIWKNWQVGIGAAEIYTKAKSIIDPHDPAKFHHMVWESDWVVPQVDLYKIHHFDNKQKATSLKVLEFNMRMDSVEDLPFAPGTVLTYEQQDILSAYRWHDIEATKLFYHRSKPQIELREKLTETFGRNMINMSNTKFGETILIAEMEKRGISCYEKVDGKNIKKQTIRDEIRLGEVTFPYIKFERPEFNRIKDYLTSQTIYETKGVFKNLSTIVDGLEYPFTTGGLHVSVESQIVCSDENMQIVDIDVASFYPNLGIKNKIYPAHLGLGFCEAYESVYQTRKTYDKGTPENAGYKEALVAAYGNSNNEFSPFLDAFYTMSITINGQLLLCMLAEQLIKTPGLRMIQANTDGITFICPKQYLDHMRSVCRWWEAVTQLELEEVLYSRMFIRDVNSYIAEKEDGSLKRIGAYAYVTAEEDPGTRELPWHKDWSARVVAMAAEACLVRGIDIDTYIRSHNDIFDFFLRTKVPKSNQLLWGGDVVPNTIRYYISTQGKPLTKVMPPAGPIGEYKRANKLTDQYFESIYSEIGPGVWDERIHTKNKSKYEERVNGFHTGWNVQLANDVSQTEWVQSNYHPKDLNYDWYVKEVEKLVFPLLYGG